MAEGTYPLQRHDGSAWTDDDAGRSALASSSLRCRSAVLYLKGDWSEYSATLGFPSWTSAIRPCFACNGSGEGLYAIAGASPLGLPFRCNEEGEYEEACSRCELIAVLDRASHATIKSLLKYDRRQDGSRGRALMQPVQSFGLMAGDRLEPCAWLPDVGGFDNVATFPYPVLFWRVSAESLTRHRNPMFMRDVGTTPFRILTVDVMHAFHLGVMKNFCCHAIWFLLESGVYGRHGTSEEVVANAILAVKVELRVWYRARHAARPDERLTRVGKVTHKMLGTAADKRLKTKGAETWGILLLLVDTFRAKRALLPRYVDRLLRAGEALVRLIRLFDAAPTRVQPDTIHEAFAAYTRFVRLTNDIPEMRIPKRHVVVHLLARLHDLGNPNIYANWFDESLNKLLKSACRAVSQSTFEASLLARMDALLATTTRKRKME